MRFILRSSAIALIFHIFLFTENHAIAIDVQRVQSKGGIVALLVEDHTNPIINAKIVFRGGSALDPENLEGLTSMVSSLLDEGAATLDSQSFQQRIKDLAMSLSFSASREVFGINLTTLTRNSEEAFSLLNLSLSQPRFDEEPVARIRSQTHAHLRQISEDPSAIAGQALFKILFDNHAYSRLGHGTPKSIDAITSDTMHRFVQRRFAKDNMVIGIVGDINAETLAELLDKTFSFLPDNAMPWALPEVLPRESGKQIIIKKDIPQSTILFAQKGMKRNNVDFYAAYVLNYILGGGGFTSRLFKEIREKRGLSYSVYSYLSPYKHTALLLGSADTANDKVQETLEVIRNEWSRMAYLGVSKEELADAKTFLTGSYPLRFADSSQIAEMLAGIQLDNLGMDYFDMRNNYIEAVTLNDVNRVALNWLNHKSLTIVIVGKPENL